MNIAFDISQTGSGKAGCGFFAYALASLLSGENKALSFTWLPNFGNFFFDFKHQFSIQFTGTGQKYGPRLYGKLELDNFWLNPNLEKILGYPNIIHSNNFWCPRNLSKSRLVYTLYDTSFLINSSWTTEENRIGCFQGILNSSVQADYIIAISEFSKQSYLEFFPNYPENRMITIYPASRFHDTSDLGRRPKVNFPLSLESFWLYVSTIEPRKNHRKLLEAYSIYTKLSSRIMPLVLVGGRGWMMDDLFEFVNKLKLSDFVKIIGYVDDSELIWLYRNCYANLYPSLYEGFGLPVLEGMQFGAPSIVSNSSSIPEVAEDACILIEPNDVEGWAMNMCALSKDSDIRNALVSKSIKQSKKYQWRYALKKVLEVYKKVTSLPKLIDER